MLKWEWMRPIRQSADNKEEAKQQSMDGADSGNEIKPIATEPCAVESVEHIYVPPCYYLFPKGKLPAHDPTKSKVWPDDF